MYFAVLALLPLLASAAPAPVKRANNQLIAAQRDGRCLSLPPGAIPSNGVPVLTEPCATASRWDISYGRTEIRLSGTNYALDLGANPGNNGGLKIWQSYPALAAQDFYYTDDKRIAQTGGNQCLDEGNTGAQTYQCTTGNTNQIWNIFDGPVTPPPSSSVAPPASSSAIPSVSSASSAAPSPSASTPADPNALLIESGPDGKCLSLPKGATPADGTPIISADCNFASRWYINKGETAIKLAGTSFAIDLGLNPGDNGPLKIWTYYPSYAPQSFYFTDDHRIAQLGGNQCFTELASGPQTNRCADLQNNQVWYAVIKQSGA